MSNIKPLDQTVAKWSRRASSAGQEYTEGVQNPRRSWAASTAAAEANYEQGVQASIARKSFGKGVSKAGDATWKDRAVSLGGGRYASGITASEDRYSKGFAPYASILASLSLPPRGSKGSPANLNRVTAVATALRTAKIGK